MAVPVFSFLRNFNWMNCSLFFYLSHIFFFQVLAAAVAAAYTVQYFLSASQHLMFLTSYDIGPLMLFPNPESLYKRAGLRESYILL